VLAAAHELLAERGLEALTMRALAEQLGVSPNALYSHVESKGALLDELLDDVLAEVETGDGERDSPGARLHAIMASTNEVLLAHPGLVPAYLARQGARGPNAQRLGNLMLEQLARAGIEGERAREALQVLIVYTIGSAAFATRGPLTAAGAAEPPAEDVLRGFDRGLRWLLAGIGAPAPG
jgi:TetR/AcrR family tetracycline transcriptional repressor